MSDKQIVWVFGDSAAGKETFVRAMISGDPPSIRDGLGWSTSSVVASDASLRWIGQIDDDPITKKRDGIFGEVSALILENDVVLLKGQIVDLEANRPQRLKQAIGGATHNIIYLDAGLQEPFDRLPGKTWANGQETLEDLQ
jgi:hypothetical protein